MQTWQDVKDFFFPAVQDTETSQMFFTTTQAVNWANGALMEMAQHSQYLDVVQTQNTSDGTRLYTVGTETYPAYGLWRAEIDDQAIRATTSDVVTRERYNWESRTGIPRFYYLDGFNVTDTEQDDFKVALYEEPDGVYELRTYAYGVPARVSDSADTDKLQVPQWAIYGVLWYMLSEAYAAETRRQNLDTSAYYRMLYDDILDRLQARTSSRLAKSWVVGQDGHDFDADFWSNLPDTIPEP